MVFRWLKRQSPGTDSPELPPSSSPLSKKQLLAPGERIYAIGDIHGKLELLERLQAMIITDLQTRPPQSARLIYLGDYIDRGGKSREVVERLLNPPPELPKAIMLRGNHEQTLLDCLDDPVRLDEWRGFGGIETMMSYGVEASLLLQRNDQRATMEAFAKASSDHFDFYASLELSAEFGNYFFCHAGVRPGVALNRQSAQDLMWIRQEFLNSQADFTRIIVHGHTPVEKPDVRPNRINIDTGAYATRKLTCAVLEAETIHFLST